MTSTLDVKRSSDWMDEIVPRLSENDLFIAFEKQCQQAGDPIKSSVLSMTYEAVYYAHHRTKMIIRYMNEYTLHDSDHLFRVLHIMSRLIPKETVEKLSLVELFLLILAAFFHDIGMAPSEREIRAWQGLFEEDAPTEYEKNTFEDYDLFRDSKPEIVTKINELKQANEEPKADLLEKHIISQYIRSTHAQRARDIISEDWAGRIKFIDYDLTNELAEICFSHNENAIKLLSLDTSISCGDDQYLCLPFLGVVLRLADVLDFDPKRTPEVLFSHLMIMNPISLQEWNKHRTIESWAISNEHIAFSAKCSHPAIEYSIRKFCDIIDEELKSCTLVLTSMTDTSRNIDHYRMRLCPQVDRKKIGPRKDIRTNEPIYIYRETSFHLNKTQVVDLLMGTKLYANPEVAIRELIQNSIDACLVARSMYQTWGQAYDPQIIVRYFTQDKEEYLQVYDNGMGMNQYILDNYYTNIGNSFYKSPDFYRLKATAKLDFTPISRFGIGILSYFMVSDSIRIETRRINDRYDLDDPLDIEIEGQDSIFHVKKGNRKEPGTTTTLLLRRENPWRTLNKEEFLDSVRRTIPNPPFEIEIEAEKETRKHSPYDLSVLTTDILKKRQVWRIDKDFVREIELDLSAQDVGIIGKATVAVIQEKRRPVNSISIQSKTVRVDEQEFDLNLSISYATNEIQKSFGSIELDDDGEIEQKESHTWIAKSDSIFSIHGIEYPNSLFPSLGDYSKKNKLRWPIPVLIVLDFSGPHELELNSARTEIVFDEKWQHFEKDLAYVLLSSLRRAVSSSYWKALKKVLREESRNEIFDIALGKV